VGPTPGLYGCGKSRLTGIRSPDRSVRSDSIHRLRYLGPQSAGPEVMTFWKYVRFEELVIEIKRAECLLHEIRFSLLVC
jgi:hypothetical protein